MSFTTYAQYAAYTALLTLMVIIISLTFKSWLEEIRFQVNYIWLKAQTPKFDEMIAEYDKNFDEHVESTPGMRNAHLN